MVIRGRSRGNGKQIGNYLLAQGENERVEIFDIDGRDDRGEALLRKSLLSMSLTSELTKSDKGLYHMQINPAYGEDKKMTREDWLYAADELGKALKLDNQRRVMVMHEKKGRRHMHVVWERYDHGRGIMVKDSFSRLAQDRARQELERHFKHRITPSRNAHRPELKEHLTQLWRQAKTGKQFIQLATDAGYTIASSNERRPFRVVDQYGIDHDLVRQIEGVKTKDVRQSFKDITLPDKKEAIAATRVKKHKNDMEDLNQMQETMIDKIAMQQDDKKLKSEQQTYLLVSGFAGNKDDTIAEDPATIQSRELQQNKADATEPPRPPTQEEIEAMQRQIKGDLSAMQERQRQQRKRGPKL